MHDRAPTHTGTDLEALTASELQALLSKCQAELAGRVMTEMVGPPPRSQKTESLGIVAFPEENKGALPSELSRKGLRRELKLPLGAGLRRRQKIRLFSRWFKDRRSKFLVIQGELLDSMPFEAVAGLGAFYTPDHPKKSDFTDYYKMIRGQDNRPS